MLTTLLAFLFALGILVFIHELGHYLVAKWCGVKVLRFSIGFGKPFLKWTVGDDRTEWSLAPIPLGGYVKMLDEREDPAAVPENEKHRAFNRQSLGKRSLIVVAGPVANFLLAILLYAVLGMAGLREPAPVVEEPAANTPAQVAGLKGGDRIVSVDGDRVDTFNQFRLQMLNGVVDRRPIELGLADGRVVQVPTTTLPEGELDKDFASALGIAPAGGDVQIIRPMADSPAEQAGLKPGDLVLSLDGHPVRSARELTALIRERAGQQVKMKLRRPGDANAEIDVSITPRAEIDAETKASVGRIGAQLGQAMELVTIELGPLEALQHGVRKTWDMSIFSLRMLGKMIMGQLSVKNLSGPVAMADYAGQAVNIGWFAYVSFLALISVSLGVLNLLPVPVLDGGHLVYYALEAIKGRPLSERFLSVTQRIGVALVAGMMIIALYNDISSRLG